MIGCRDPQSVALKLIQLELDRSHLLGRIGIGSLDRPKDFTLAAKEHDAEAAFHPAGELSGVVFRGAAAGWHGMNLDIENPRVESINRPSTNPPASCAHSIQCAGAHLAAAENDRMICKWFRCSQDLGLSSTGWAACWRYCS